MRLRPLEAINFAALLLPSGLALCFRNRLSDPEGILLRYALLGAFLAVIAALERREERLPAALRIALNFYPAVFIPLIFESLGPLIPAARGRARDVILIAADRALFGVDPTVWLERFVWAPLTDFLYIAYAAYFFLALLLGACLWAQNSSDAKRYIFTITLSFYVSYVGYFTVPAYGPRFALAAEHSVSLHTTPIARAISRTINELEHTKMDVFPSGHTMIATVVLLVAFARMRRLFWILLPVVTALLISTVYCRYHYVVDVIAGIVLAFLTAPLGDRLYDRLTETRVEGSRSQVPS